MTSQSFLTSYGVNKPKKRYKVKFTRNGEKVTVVGVKACSPEDARQVVMKDEDMQSIENVKVIETEQVKNSIALLSDKYGLYLNK